MLIDNLKLNVYHNSTKDLWESIKHETHFPLK